MAVIALTSASGSPGVTTTAVALAFLWPRPVVLVEADPTGAYQAVSGSPVPGTIQAEDFDNGGEGVAYHDVDSTNNGGDYRSTGVDIDLLGGGGYYVGWTKAGEWINYTFNVNTTGSFDIETRYSSKALGGNFRIEIDGIDVTGSKQVPNTGSWSTYTTAVLKSGLTLSAGQHTMRVVMLINGSTGSVGNFDWFKFVSVGTPTNQPPVVSIITPTNNQNFPAGSTIDLNVNVSDPDGTIAKVEYYANGQFLSEDTSAPDFAEVWSNVAAGTYQITAKAYDNLGAVTTSAPITIIVGGGGGGGQTPFSGTPIAIPGIIQAEDFDNGGEGVAYHDLTTANEGGDYRTTGVDVDVSGDTGGGHYVGWTKAGEWLEYTINIGTGGTYDLLTRLSAKYSGAKFHVEIDGLNVTGNIDAPNTGSWSTFTTLTTSGINLTAGQHVLRVVMDTNNTNGTVANFNWFQIAAATPGAPAAPSGFDATPVSPTQVNLSWADNSGNETGFKIERKTGSGGTWGQIDTVGANVTSYSDTTAAAGTSYFYRVRAYNGSGNSAYSNEDGATTPTDGTTITWAAKANSPVKRYEAPSVVINGQVWVFGGWNWDSAASILRASQRVDVYNPVTNTWTNKANMPTKLTHQGVVVDGNSIYMVGGFVGDDPGVGTAQIWKYSISANTWSDAGFDLPEVQASGAAVLIGRNLHVFGGSEGDRLTDTGQHWSINIDNTAAGWTVRANMPNPRHHFSAAVLNGKIYVFGGQHEHDSGDRIQDATAHVYDPATNTWSAIATMPYARSHAEPGTFVMNGKIVMGGGITDGRVNLSSLLEYDPVTNTYRELTPLPLALKAPVVQLVNGQIFVTGGEANVGGTQNKSYLGTFT